MKIVITGHTNGLGEKIFSHYHSQASYQVSGFSSKNGYKISSQSDIDKIILESLKADVFINNAHIENWQSTILSKLFFHWSNQNKLIINISAGPCAAALWKLVDDQYIAQKASLNALSTFFQQQKKTCRIATLHLDTLDIKNTQHLEIEKLSCDNVIKAIDFIIKMPKGLEVSDVTLRAKKT